MVSLAKYFPIEFFLCNCIADTYGELLSACPAPTIDPFTSWLQVLEVSTSKTGKHGHAKCNFTATDIFTGKKYEDMCPSSHNVDVPNIHRMEYFLLDINDEGFLSLMEENGNVREDLKLPRGTDEADKLAADIEQKFENGEELHISVVKAMDTEMVKDVKASNPNPESKKK